MRRILTESWSLSPGNCLQSLLPHRCLLCDEESHEALCPACAADIPPLTDTCPQCADASAEARPCGRCLAHPPHFDATFSPFIYDFPLDRLIHACKYGGELTLIPWFASHMANKLDGLRFDRLLPMPLHPKRLRERGFNQSAELARSLGRLLDTPVDLFSCRRIRATPAQADLPHKKRADNVRGAFECSRSCTGEHLLLVDDVMTTGASADECARTLKLHGAASVTVLVIARALRQ